MKRLTYLFVIFLSASCGEKYLDIKPSLNQRVPNTVEDYLGILDAVNMMNRNSSHVLGFIGNDEFYMLDAEYHSFPVGADNNYQKNAYTWNQVVYEGGETAETDWSWAYTRIMWANLVLSGLDKIDVTADNIDEVQLARGIALFHRAYNYYSLAQLYADPYDEQADIRLGIPLRKESTVDEVLTRAPLVDTYALVFKDLMEAETLLPDRPESPFKYRPSKWAVYALCARVSLQMGEYADAERFASRCLELGQELIDFNEVKGTNETNPFPLNSEGNPEVIFNTTLNNRITLTRLYYHPDTALLASYGTGDLRKDIYFSENGGGRFTGSYDGSNLYFTGLAVDEMYLIKAECDVRLGNETSALNVLNALKKNRYDIAYYLPYESNDPEEILDWVLTERKKELVMRGTRWEDLRRLNKEARYAKTLYRSIGTQDFELPPNDVRYIWPLPAEAVQIGKYEQNQR